MVLPVANSSSKRPPPSRWRRSALTASTRSRASAVTGGMPNNIRASTAPDHQHGQVLLADCIQSQHATSQRHPLLRPLAGPKPGIDHVGQTGAGHPRLTVAEHQTVHLGSGEGVHPPIPGLGRNPSTGGKRLQGSRYIVVDGEASGGPARGQIGRTARDVPDGQGPLSQLGRFVEPANRAQGSRLHIARVRGSRRVAGRLGQRQ